VTVQVISKVLVAAQAPDAPPETAANVDPPGAYDLVDLATAKDEFGIKPAETQHDSFLQRTITGISAAISKHCNRVFQTEVIQDTIYLQQDPYPWQTPGGVDALQLSRWPLNTVDVANFTGNTNASTVLTGLSSIQGIEAGTLVFASDGSIPHGAQVESFNSATVKLTLAATSRAPGLSFNTGLQVVQLLPGPNNPQTLVCGKDFTVDAERGWLIRLNAFTGVAVLWETVPLTVIYQAGFDDIPPDLVEGCLRWLTARFRAKGRDPMLVEDSQPGLGTSRYWVGSTPGSSGGIPPEIAEIVDNYRVPVIG
jgi:hypothetical protein